METEELFEAVEQRALVYLQTLEYYHGENISDNQEWLELFLLGVYLGSMSAVEVFGEHDLFEVHTGPEYDYLYEYE